MSDAAAAMEEATGAMLELGLDADDAGLAAASVAATVEAVSADDMVDMDLEQLAEVGGLDLEALAEEQGVTVEELQAMIEAEAGPEM